MLMQLHSTFLWYLNVSDAQYRMQFWAKLYKSTCSIYSSYSWLVINVPLCIEINYIGRCQYWTDSVQYWSKSRSTFDVFLLLISK